MKHSSERILTTHAGSLARPDALRDLLNAKDERKPYDEAAFKTQVTSAVAGVVKQQIAVGLDIVNDGEQSKRNFTTYARERLAGIEERLLEPGERVLAMIYGRDAAEFPVSSLRRHLATNSVNHTRKPSERDSSSYGATRSGSSTCSSQVRSSASWAAW